MAPHVSTAPADRWTAWDDFVEATPATGFMQTSWWADFRTSDGFSYVATILRSAGDVVGGAVVQRFCHTPDACFYYMPDGPVLPRDPRAARSVFAALLHDVDARRRDDDLVVSHLRIEPRWDVLPDFVLGFRPPPRPDRFGEPRDTRCIDLRPPEAAILAQMKPKGRYNVGLARRRGVTVVEDTTAGGLADFVRLYTGTAERQGFAAKPPEYFGELLTVLASVGRGHLYFAEHDGARLAAALVVSFGGRATYFFGGSSTERRELMAPYLLHFEIMRAARAAGHREYDLWGIAPAHAPDSPWRSFSDFKAKLGGRTVHLVPALDFVLDEAAYARYLEAAS